MSATPNASDSQPAEQEMGRLYDRVRRALAYGQLAEARAAADELLELAPDSTSAQELSGDVLLAEGKRDKAMAAYHRALEIAEGNVDAERKYAELTLSLGEEQRQKEELARGDIDRFKGAANKQPNLAASRSMLFPGLGQLYNGEYTKGSAIAITGCVLLVVAAVIILPSGPHSGWSAAWKIWLGWPALYAYPVLWGYSIYDAWRTCKAHAEPGSK